MIAERAMETVSRFLNLLCGLAGDERSVVGATMRIPQGIVGS